MMSFSNIKQRIMDFFVKVWAYMKKLFDKIRACDRYTLICLITGVIFFVFATLQLVLMMATPESRTFDHISVIVLDYIIVAFCLVFVLYKSGRLNQVISGSSVEKFLSERQNSDAPAPENSVRPAHETGVSTGPSSEFVAMGHMNVSGEIRRRKPGSVPVEKIDESLISPGHRYSAENGKRRL